jgi:hypothetical protein
MTTDETMTSFRLSNRSSGLLSCYSELQLNFSIHLNDVRSTLLHRERGGIKQTGNCLWSHHVVAPITPFLTATGFH